VQKRQLAMFFFGAFGIWARQSCSWNVDEIDPLSRPPPTVVTFAKKSATIFSYHFYIICTFKYIEDGTNLFLEGLNNPRKQKKHIKIPL